MRCVAPMMIKNPEYNGQDRMIPVRCGKCEGCLKSTINDWSFRLEQEAKRSFQVHFVTLTYTPEFVPLTPQLLPTLKKRDVQNYMKRLRKLCGQKLRYFAVGEYGSKSYRPHYHLILFNVEDPKNIVKAWRLRSKDIGNVHIGDDVAQGAIPYTLKYIYKKGMVPAFEADDRLPEFRIMSNRLGDNYLSHSVIKWHLEDLKTRQYVRNNAGIQLALPRFYRERLIALSGRHRKAFRDDTSVFLTSDDGDYRSLQSRVSNIKNNVRKFEKKRNQQTRKKL